MLGDRKYRLVSIKVIEVYGKFTQCIETNISVCFRYDKANIWSLREFNCQELHFIGLRLKCAHVVVLTRQSSFMVLTFLYLIHDSVLLSVIAWIGAVQMD